MQYRILLLAPIVCLVLSVLMPSSALAHQPRLVDADQITVVAPAVSKAYYGTLSGTPHTYTITTATPLMLYAGILMPYAEDSRKDVSAEIRRGDELIAVIGGQDAAWTKMFEFFGRSYYWDGGDYRGEIAPGTYTIVVQSPGNDRKYSLAIGELESFSGTEIVNAVRLIPLLKRDFFNESPIGFILSPFGWGYILSMYALACIAGFAYRYMVQTIARGTVRGVTRNIGMLDRAVRLTLAVGLLLLAITTTWNPWLIFFSGFALFEALFSWCGLYAAIGKNTCAA